MPRYFLEVAYRGTQYSGFQVQENQPTIQSAVGQALEILFRRPFSLTGSSRTDAGVHALQNFFHFDTDLIISGKSIYNINALLPRDIAAKALYQVGEDAHCRFDAVAREYQYFIHREKNPFLTDRGWLYPYPVSLALLQEMARILGEYQDFTSFSKRNTQVKTFLCQIERSEWYEANGQLVYHIKANRFLRGMVRGLVGTMLRIARENWDNTGEGAVNERVTQFRQVIEAMDCTKADFSTPPQGLFLVRVQYKETLERMAVH
ncbi:MAG: tRNA pseudouridine(38-40) synthase TruA [Sediminibacterium sp.]